MALSRFVDVVTDMILDFKRGGSYLKESKDISQYLTYY